MHIFAATWQTGRPKGHLGTRSCGRRLSVEQLRCPYNSRTLSKGKRQNPRYRLRQASMDGETDLSTLLADMRPQLSEIPFVFAIVASPEDIPPGTTINGTFLEDEGLTIVGPLEELAWSNLERSCACAKITLAVHSSLSAVGLTAKVTSALADHGISANVIAAFFHDHIFVAWEKRQLAMDVLTKLGRASI